MKQSQLMMLALALCVVGASGLALSSSSAVGPREGVGLEERLPDSTVARWEAIGGGCPPWLAKLGNGKCSQVLDLSVETPGGTLPCQIGTGRLGWRAVQRLTGRPLEGGWTGHKGETWHRNCDALQRAFAAGALGAVAEGWSGQPTLREGLLLAATTSRDCRRSPQRIGCLYRFLPSSLPPPPPPPPPPPSDVIIQVDCTADEIVLQPPPPFAATFFRPGLASTGRMRLQLVGTPGQRLCLGATP